MPPVPTQRYGDVTGPPVAKATGAISFAFAHREANRMSSLPTATNQNAAERLVGDSAWATKLRTDIRQAAPFRSAVLITGPTGTGKELVARALHESSDRADKPFIPVNCAAAAPQLFASHLFGHEKGAFTGADYATLGCFRAASGGTVFLDEIGELDLDLQAKLLRVLQEKAVTPVGSYDAIPIDTRIVSATNRNLHDEISKGRFREDLLYRLNVVTLATAPLIQRSEDIPLIARHCLKRIAAENGLPLCELSPAAVRWMVTCHWPGNVRQLQNVLERAVIYSSSQFLDANDLAAAVAHAADHRDPVAGTPDTNESSSPRAANSNALSPLTTLSPSNPSDEEWPQLEQLEAEHIRLTLQHTYFNQTAAANLLGISYRTLARKIKRYGIDVSLSRRGRPPKHRKQE